MELSIPWVDPIWLENLQVQLEYWFLVEVLTWTSLAQLAAVIVAALLSWPASRPIAGLLRKLPDKTVNWDRRIHNAVTQLPSLAFPATYWVSTQLAIAIAASTGHPYHILTIVLSLLSAWLVIRLATSVIANREVARVVSILAWGIATLNILGLLEPLQVFLEGIAIPLGSRRITVMSVIEAIILFVVLLWLAGAAGRFIAVGLNRSRTLTPSIKVLAEKGIKVALIASVFLLTLNYLGVDLTAFAVFTGAIGVGVGFGLQKVISNLISGFILLLDRSIKPGDVIEIGDTFGWVDKLSARYVALTTRDGRELLIPNEDLITHQVINWSYTNKQLRLPLRFGIAYESDVRKAMELAIDGALSVDRVLKDPKPVCRLMGFGDSSVDFELRVWINDPEAGVVNVKSDVYLALWDRFHEHDIQIPFPQREITIKKGSTVSVAQESPEVD